MYKLELEIDKGRLAAFAVGIMVMLVGCTAAAPSPTATLVPTSTPEPPVVSDPLQIGDVAPDFTLPDGDGNMISLADQLLSNELIILVFYSDYT